MPPNEKVEIQTWARPDDFVRYGHRALVGLRADDVKAVSIERLCVSLSSCRKIFKLKKVNKSFVTEPISCFRIPIYVYEHFMNIMSISHIRILGILQSFIIAYHGTLPSIVWKPRHYIYNKVQDYLIIITLWRGLFITDYLIVCHLWLQPLTQTSTSLSICHSRWQTMWPKNRTEKASGQWQETLKVLGNSRRGVSGGDLWWNNW